jgi:hypothetical protein
MDILLEQIENGLVKLGDLTEEEKEIEQRISDKGYEFAFGPSNMSREEFSKFLPDLTK